MLRSKSNKFMLSISVIAMVSALAPSAHAQSNGDEIIATGVRYSIKNSIQKKRDADVVIDAITSEDIGLFTDQSITDSIQRIPGVQIERDEAGTDGDRVSIRGLGPQFVNTTVNGRSLLSSGTEGLGNLRSVNIGAFPSEVVNGVTVEKSTAAARPESGLGGSVDIQTLKPLDARALKNEKFFANATSRVQQAGTLEDTGYLLSGAIGGRNEDSTIGAYVSVAAGNTKRRIEQVNMQSVQRNITLSTGVQSLLVPNALTRSPVDQDIDRLAIAGGFQAIEDNVEFSMDATFTSIDNRSDRKLFQTLFGRSYAGVTPAENVTIDENGVLQRLDFAGQRNSPLLRSNNLGFDNKTENLILGANLKIDSGNIRQGFDVYHSTIDYTQNIRQALFQIANWDDSNVVFASEGFEVPTLQGLGDRATDSTGFANVFGAAREIYFDAEKSGARYDLEMDINRDFIETVQLGAEYTMSDLSSFRTLNERFTRVAPATAVDVLQAALTGNQTTGFLSDVDGYAPNDWFTTDYRLAAPFLREGFLTESGVDDLGFEPLSSFEVEEDVLSLFGQVNFANREAKTPFSGNFGLRVVNTDIVTSGFAIGDGIVGDPQPVEFEGSDWTLLPSGNIRFELSDEFAARFSIGKTLTRPNQSDISPRVSVAPRQTDPLDEDFGRRSVAAGNPDLKPIKSINYDATFEWYPTDDGSFIVSLFYKDVSDFIISEATVGQLQGFGSEEFRIIAPINFSDGTAKGFEVGLIQDLTFLPGLLSKTGVQANYTYVDSGFDKDVGDAGFGFPGASKNNYNVSGYYEDGPITLRAAYTFRDEYFRSLAGTGAQNANARFTEGYGQLDLSAVWRISKDLRLNLAATNVTNSTRRDFIGQETTFLDYFDRGRVLSASLRASF